VNYKDSYKNLIPVKVKQPAKIRRDARVTAMGGAIAKSILKRISSHANIEIKEEVKENVIWSATQSEGSPSTN